MLIGVDASRSDLSKRTGTEYYSARAIEHITAQAISHNYRLYTRPAVLLGKSDARIRVLSPNRLWTHVALGRELWRNPPDALFVPAHVLPISLALKKPKRVVITVHDAGFRHFPAAHTAAQRAYLDWSTRFACHHADVVICDSINAQSDLAHFYQLPMRKSIVAHPGFDVPESATEQDVVVAASKLNLPPDAPVVLFVGTLQPRKNIMRLLAAFAHVLAGWAGELKPVLVLAGAQGWGNEDYPAAAHALGIREAVRFTGYVDDHTKAALMRRATVFAFPSLHEGFGFPVLEAQSVGLPVLCSNSSSLPEVAGDAAQFVVPLSVEAIAAGLTGLLESAALRDTLRVHGLRNIQRFSWPACARAILDAIEGPH